MSTSGPLVVLGDTLLDVDVVGTAERLSPDAPVPVVDVRRQWQRPGGAGLAALLAARGGAEVILVTALGQDPAAEVLLELLSGQVDVRALPLTGETVCKTRIGAAGVPMLRLDAGSGRAAEANLSPSVRAALTGAGAVLVSDYGRGVAALPAVRELLRQTARHVPVVWDPHPRGAEPVPGCSLVTPNAAEARQFSEVHEPAEAGRVLAERWTADAVAVTLGGRGAVLAERTGRTGTAVVPGPASDGSSRPDTCGAGDQFAAAATAALLAGDSVLSAVRTAVDAATGFVRSGSAASVSVAAESAHGPASRPVPGRSHVFDLVDRVRRSGGRVVATGGCFDLLHPGHVSLLRQARALGDVLVVCLNSDTSVRRAKGPNRPVVAQQDRADVLTALSAVDGVLIFDEPTPSQLLARLRPDVWVKGSDYAEQDLPETEVVRRHGGEVVLVQVVPGHSTTRLVAAARRTVEELSSYPAQEAS